MRLGDWLGIGLVLLGAAVGSPLLLLMLMKLPPWRYFGISVEVGHLSLLVAAIVAVVGWHAGHVYTSQRDADNKRRELWVKYLVEVYRKVESLSDRPEITLKPDQSDEDKEAIDKVESAFADLQLFGDERQRTLAKTLIAKITETQGKHRTDASKLLVVLRKGLRDELRLAPAPDDPKDIVYFRVREKPVNVPKNAPGDPR
jgi:hypothetical protein